MDRQISDLFFLIWHSSDSLGVFQKRITVVFWSFYFFTNFRNVGSVGPAQQLINWSCLTQRARWDESSLKIKKIYTSRLFIEHKNGMHLFPCVSNICCVCILCHTKVLCQRSLSQKFTLFSLLSILLTFDKNPKNHVTSWQMRINNHTIIVIA